jgi:ABC-type Na+ efflux pump permease subunit
MQSVAFPQLAWHITRKDWAESSPIILMLTAALMIPAVLTRVDPDNSAGFATGLLAGLLIGTSFGYAQYTFANERQRGTLELLRSLPITARQLVLAKYISLYSMVLFTINIPALIVPNLTMIYMVNCSALFMSTLFMSATVISDKPWAPQLPLYFLVILILPIQRLLIRYFPQGLTLLDLITTNPTLVPTIGLGLTPLLVLVSMVWFEHSVGDRPTYQSGEI